MTLTVSIVSEESGLKQQAEESHAITWRLAVSRASRSPTRRRPSRKLRDAQRLRRIA
jgi:hypothetical protein